MADDDDAAGLFDEPAGFYKESPRATTEEFERLYCPSDGLCARVHRCSCFRLICAGEQNVE
jgi:hypothetical protein